MNEHSGAERFSTGERMAFFRKKWLREHIALLVCMGAVVVGVLLTGIITGWLLLIPAAMLLLLAAYLIGYNRMMIYVEKRAFEEDNRP